MMKSKFDDLLLPKEDLSFGNGRRIFLILLIKWK